MAKLRQLHQYRIDDASEEHAATRHLLASPLTADSDTHCIRIRNSASYMVAQVHQYSNGCGPTRSDAEIYARLFVAAPAMLAALEECALQIAQTRNRLLTAGERAALDNAQSVIAAARGA
jgi:hypothetical protein